MPYPNEHSCRLIEPSTLHDFSRKNNGGVSVILAHNKEGKQVVQAIRYPKGNWTEERARKSCSDHGGSFEAAVKNEVLEKIQMTDKHRNGLYHVTLNSMIKWSKNTDQMVELEGTIIKEGMYTGIDGHTILWPEDVIKAMHTEFVGVPVIRRHTDTQQNTADLAVGYVKGAAMNGQSALHQSIVYNPSLFNAIMNGDIAAVSPEIDVKMEWSPTLGAYIAREGHPTALCLTNVPACPEAQINDSHYVTQVRMEYLGTDDKKQVQIGGKEMSDASGATDNAHNPEAVSWENMSPEEKLKKVQKFCDEKGYNLVANKNQLEDMKKKEEEEEKAEKEKAELKSKYEAMSSRIKNFEDKDLAMMEAAIKEVDAEFDTKALMEAGKTYEQKKVLLETTLKTIGRVAKIKMQIGAPGKATGEDQIAKLEKDFTSGFSLEYQKLLEGT